MPAGGVRFHYVVPLVIAYVVARSALADLVNSTNPTVEYEVTSSRPAPHVVPLEEHVSHVAAAHVAENISTDSGYDPLFGPHDPNRVYTHKEKKYFQVGVIDFERVRTPFVIGSWILAASLAKIGFHMFPKLSHMFPESCLLIVIGIIVGVILYFGGLGDVEAAHHLDPDTFFLFMLPPIILDAGYFMPNRLFFDNLGTILLFAVVGTIFNTFTIGGGLYLVGLTGLYGVEMPILNTFLFAALISAVDPVAVLAVFEEIHVNEMLYIVVFGESLLNDAVTVVLYHMFEAYVEMGENNITALDVAAGLLKFLIVALGGTLVGIIWGFLTAFVTRFTSSVRVIEPLFVFIMSYLAYLNAEIFHLSGILAITFCGLTMKNYVVSNVSAKSHTTIKYTMKMLSSSSETVIFMLLGVATVHNHHVWNTYFVLFTILFCSLFRALGVLILAGLANRARMHKIEGVEKFVMMYGGLRGAVAFALVLLIDPHHVPQQQMFLTTTITVVYFTVFVQGMSIKPLVEKLGVKRANKRKLTMNERIHERSLDHIMAGIEDIVGHPGRYYLRDMFKHLNHKYLRPLLTHEDTTRDPKIMETFSKLALKDAMKSAVDDVINGGQKSARMRSSASWGDIIRDNSNWNLSRMDRTYMPDMNEIRYNPSMKDLNDATIHHLLDADQDNPRQRRRRWSYSRHAVCDDDMHTRPVNHTMQIYMKQRMIDMYRRKKQRNQNGSPRKNVSFAVQTNGSTVKLKDDDLYEVIDSVPTCRETRTCSASPKDPSEDPDDVLSFDAPDGRADSVLSDVSDHITTTESVLPWKRDDEILVCQRPLKWHNTSAPAWISNEDYTNYASPPESMTVMEPELQPPQEEGLRARRSSLTSSFRAGLRSLRSSLRRQLGGSPPPPPVPHEPSAISEDGESTVVSTEDAIKAAVEAAVEVRAAAAAQAAEATAAPPSGEATNQSAAKPGSLDESVEESGRRNFTTVSIDQCEEEKERTRL